MSQNMQINFTILSRGIIDGFYELFDIKIHLFLVN